MSGFDYHKPAFPLDWGHDGITVLLASIGLIIAASGGIGGGGILVPIFIMVLGFRTKHAVALSNVTILGGAMANTALNVQKKHPRLDRGLIDWDLILAMEPLTIIGAIFGSLLSKVIPNAVLTASLVIILALMGHRTLTKGIKMWREESKGLENDSSIEMAPTSEGQFANSNGLQTDFFELSSGNESELDGFFDQPTEVGKKVIWLTFCFAGTCVFTILKGGGNFVSPVGVGCASKGFWLLYFSAVPWVLTFAVGFRRMLMNEHAARIRCGASFSSDEVQWDSWNTIKYPLICAIAGLLAGLFGVGGGIVKGPLMLEMGIMPAVAAASAAAMILYTSAAASISFMVFGLLDKTYGAIFFTLGIIGTTFGQCVVSRWSARHKRQSPTVLSIGLVIVLSSFFIGVNTAVTSAGLSLEELLRTHSLCNSEV